MHFLRRRKLEQKSIFGRNGFINFSERAEQQLALSLNGSSHQARTGQNWSREKELQGQVATKKLRVVCTLCNNEWMSGIETASEFILTPLIIGKECKLDIINQKMIAIWVALKILTIEHNDLENVITDQEVRQKFKNSRKIPDGMKIWIAQCGSGGWRFCSLLAS